jgi:ATP-dependent protease HslVU (ClpYQ) peptidase subunit
VTTIAVRNGVMAADSRVTVQTEEGGSRVFRCEKLYPIRLERKPAVVGVAGGSFDGLAFLDWLVSGSTEPPDRLLDGEADFTALVLTQHGLFEYDKWCRPERVLERFYAVGSGTKAALGAMHMGATAHRAVSIACKIDPYSAPPIVTMSLETARVQLADAGASRRSSRR